MIVPQLLLTMAVATAAPIQEGMAQVGPNLPPPPATWWQDPGDSTYREARSMLNRGNYTRAADLFPQLSDRYPRSSYAPDAYYWGAYALSRAGSVASLNQALELLRVQERQFPDASTRRSAEELLQRIRGQLARQGDEAAARSVREQAAELAQVERDLARARREAARTARTVRVQDRCQDDDDERIAALNALLQMDSERAIPILEKVMARRDEGSACLRRRALFMLSQHPGPRTEALLLSAVRSDVLAVASRQRGGSCGPRLDPSGLDRSRRSGEGHLRPLAAPLRPGGPGAPRRRRTHDTPGQPP
jgi:tetratricopeptide (TPR) repeat protein